MSQYILVPRRHDQETLGILVRWYSCMALLGAAAVVAVASVFAVLGVSPTPRTFMTYFTPVGALGIALMIYVWHKHVQPKIRQHREDTIKEFEALTNQKYRM